MKAFADAYLILSVVIGLLLRDCFGRIVSYDMGIGSVVLIKHELWRLVQQQKKTRPYPKQSKARQNQSKA